VLLDVAVRISFAWMIPPNPRRKPLLEMENHCCNQRKQRSLELTFALLLYLAAFFGSLVYV
jgi:hypothetical protein